MTKKPLGRHDRRRRYTTSTAPPAAKYVLCTQVLDGKVCGKRTYMSRSMAKAAARVLGNGTPYECGERGSGLWHLTTADAASREWFRERDERRGIQREMEGEE